MAEIAHRGQNLLSRLPYFGKYDIYLTKTSSSTRLFLSHFFSHATIEIFLFKIIIIFLFNDKGPEGR